MTDAEKKLAEIAKIVDGGSLINRLRGHYVTGINHARDFSPYVPPICIEAAKRIEELEVRVRELEDVLADVLNETSHTGKWEFNNVLPKELWDRAWEIHGGVNK